MFVCASFNRAIAGKAAGAEQTLRVGVGPDPPNKDYFPLKDVKTRCGGV